MTLELVPKENPVLREVTPPFDFTKFDAPELFGLMKEAMVRLNGLGLSAPQVGLRHRVFVMGNPGDADSVQAVFNPKLLVASEETDVLEEGCLTFPGLLLKVRRSKTVRVRFTDHLGETDTFTLSGMTARVFQHELDHLDGILFTRRATRYHLEQAHRHLEKRKAQRHILAR